MNIFHSSEKADPGNKQASLEEAEENINPYPHEANIADGGEFLDDALRMKEQPFGESATEENQ